MENYFQQQLSTLQKALPSSHLSSDINYSELSYHQYNHLQISSASTTMLNALSQLETVSPNTKIYDNLFTNSSTMANSVLTYVPKLVQFLQKDELKGEKEKVEKSNKILVHSHYSSQSVLLGSYMNHLSKKKPIVMSSKNQMEKFWVSCLVPESEVDKKSAFNQLIEKQKLKVHYWDQNQQVEKDDNFFYIIDLFNIHPLQYQPYLLKILKFLQENKKQCLLYCSHLQQEEVIDILGQSQELNWEFYEINSSYPSDIFKGKIEDELFKFLNQEANHPFKQDIVIFHEPNNLFLKKINQILKKHKFTTTKLITGAHEAIAPSNTTNIYIATNSDILLSWNYSLSRVFQVFDYRTDVTFHFDYNYLCYVETRQEANKVEIMKRMSFIGANRLGKYCYEEELSKEENFLVDRKVVDLGHYCLKMIQYGFFEKLDSNNDKVKECLKALERSKIIKKNQSVYQIQNPEILSRFSFNLNPLYAKAVLDHKKSPKMAYLLVVAASVLMTPGSLRQPTKEGVVDRPSGIWRQTGYLHSCIDAIIRCKIIDARSNKENISKRLTSKQVSRMSETEFDVFGSLFEIIQANRMTFDEMKIQDLIREEFLNEKKLLKIIQKVDDLAEQFGIEEVEFTSFEHINEVMTALLSDFDRGAGVYSGSRRIGYFVKGERSGIFPNKNSLISTLNERPSFILLNRLLKENGKLQILMSNHLSQSLFMQIFGELPTSKQSSYGETQIQFHGVSSAIFANIWKTHEVANFQKQYECFVEPNEEVAMITIHCSKERQITVKKQFEQLLAKIKKKITMETKIVNYFANTNVMLGNGGSAMQIIKNRSITQCILSNLDVSVTETDLYDLFDQFFTLKSITMHPLEQKAHFISATIEFNSQKDFYRFKEYYHECEYMDRMMKVLPIESKPKRHTLTSEMYVQCSWFSWKSHSRAIIEFQNEEHAVEAVKSLQSAPLDNKKVKAMLKGKMVLLENIKTITDEIFIEKALRYIGKIKSIQVERTPLKESSNIEEHLKSEVNEVFEDDDVQFQIRKVEKLKNGLRKCQISFNNIDKLNKLVNELNEKTGIIGVARVHLHSWFTYPIIVPNNCNILYEQLITDVLAKIPNNQIEIHHQIFNGQDYCIAKSGKKQEIDVFKEKISLELKGFEVELTGLQKSILLSEVGIHNLMDLEEKYICQLVPDFNKKTLTVLARFQNVKKIKEEIKAKVQDKFFYRIPLNQRSFKYLKEHPDKYLHMEKQYHLTHLQLEEVGKNLILQGSAHHVQNALTYLMHLVESLVVSAEEMLNADVCGICCEQPFRPYRLQQCGHKFCMQCVVDTVVSTLGDISMFPVKCPQCLMEFAIEDLNALLTESMWLKLISMSVNQYVGKNPEKVTFCFTAGCKQVNEMKTTYFKCDACQTSYCLQCKMNYHRGLTCQQAKEGGNALFEKFMKENNIRKCPNKSCLMPIQRLDGCYRVTCTRCGKSMCFKCEPDKMIAYDHYNDCYKHLSEVHGSYW